MVGRIEYLDGMRGIGAIIVFLFHFVLAFPTRTYGDFFSSSPFLIFFEGRFAVCLFFVLSGFVLTHKFYSTGDREILISSASRRYFRLLPPVAAAVFVSYLFMVSGIYMNRSAGEIIGRGAWLGLWNNFPPEYTGMLKEALFSTFFGSAPWNQYRYVHTLWTMFYEFFGSLLVLSLAALFGGSRWRWLTYIAAVCYFATTYYLGFIMGMLLADYHANRGLMSPRSKFLMVAFVMSVVLMGVSSFSEVFYNTARASFAIFIVISSRAAQNVLANRILLFLGRISFSFYVLHLIVLFSFSSTLFIWMHDAGVTYDTSVPAILVCTLFVLVVVSSLFQMAIDDKGIEFSKLIYAKYLREMLYFLR